MCSKITFTKRDAESSLKRITRMRRPHRKEKRIYYCKEHNGWHLTSKDDKFENPVTETDLLFKNKWNELLTG